MNILIGFLLFLIIDSVATLMLLSRARKDPELRERLDYNFGRLIGRPERF